jgi:cytochrome c
MKIRHVRIAVLLAILSANGNVALASKQDDKEMKELARSRGCYLCHRIEPPKPGGQETLPLGPAWKDVAKRYRSLDNAAERLTRIVLEGTGSYPGDRHWKGKAKEAQMPPSAVEISAADARKLVDWILTLDK